ncbi:lipid-binding SYLF domain-containing protein [Rhodospirillaceae bacterium KN72]|uniref:Lipid-binding SYLF domain-containing protein n=1 Tax=Pacificispira spongiicola TaxID=2729598 RepID=A0A7Y0E023_9PROT|nr:YSC84-related protein [Pacificispira spongiicola]NMM44760.1 lipid-binding SYLF domain-containing protein [Pacificispira spongiicola]
MRIATALAALLALAPLYLAAPARAADKLDAEELVTESEITVRKMWDHPDFSDYVRHYLKQAKAVVIVPSMLKGGFIIGGEGGSGIIMARAQNNDWSYPAFLSVGSASIGFQIGGQSSEMLLIVMTGKGLQAILDDQVKVGGELTGAFGPYGGGTSASTTTNMDADIIAYSIAKGVFVGASLEGTALIPRESLNRDYYGRSVSPHEIVLNGVVGNPQADELRATLKRLVTTP